MVNDGHSAPAGHTVSSHTNMPSALALALVCVFPGSLDAWIGFVQMVLLAVGAGLLLRSMYPGAREEAPLLG